MFMYPDSRVKNFSQWAKAVDKEAEKLRYCYDYLTEQGKHRYHVFVVLGDIAQFCNTAAEMVGLVHTGEDLTADDIECIKSIDACGAMVRLKQLAAEEQEA